MKMNAWNKKGQKDKKSALRIVAIVILILAALVVLMENNLRGVILRLASAKASAYAISAVNRATDEIMSGIDPSIKLVSVRTDDSGEISMLESNTILMNSLAVKIASRTSEIMHENDADVIMIPLGAVTGIEFLAGMGPRIPVSILPIGTVTTSFASEFETAGINQTRHKIILRSNCKVHLVVPTGAKTVSVVHELIVSENIVVGRVPDAFTDVNNEDDMLNLLP